ncbi:MAG: YbhB/YbcL family Raf kinase inhibitor-like protein [Patescibacteria group bacterium]
MIPKKYGRDFENVNPPLRIEDVPEEAVSLVLTMDDPDIPEAVGIPVWDHWVVFNLSPNVCDIPEHWSVEGIRGKGTRGELGYGGPRPPDKEHRYFFTVYAIDILLDLSEGATKVECIDAMADHVLEKAELMGRFAPTVSL